MGTTADKLSYLQATKTAIKNAIIAKGVNITDNNTFREYAELIDHIQSLNANGVIKLPKASNYTSGYTVIGNGVTITQDNVASGFTSSSYIKLNFQLYSGLFDDGNVVRFYCRWDRDPSGICGIMGGLGTADIITPFYYDSNLGGYCCYVGSGGTTWDIAQGITTGLIRRELMRFEIASSGGTYTITSSYGNDGKLPGVKTIATTTIKPAENGEMQIGTNRGQNNPFSGRVDLNDCFITVNDEVVWEAVAGAHTIVPYTPPQPSSGGIEVTGNDASFTIKAGTKYNQRTFDSETGTESVTVEELDNDITIADYQVSEFDSNYYYNAPETQSTAYGAIKAAYTGSSVQGTFTVSLSDGGVTYTNITCGRIMYSTDQSGYWSVPSSRARRAEVSGLTAGKTYTLSSGPLCSYNVVYPQYGSSTQFDIFVTDGDLSTVKYAGRVSGNRNGGTSSYYLPTSNNITFSPDSSGKAYIYLVTVSSSIPFASMSTYSGTRYQVGCFKEDKDMTDKTLNLSMEGFDFGGGSPQLNIRLSDSMPYEEPPEDIVYTVTTDSVDGSTLVSSGETPWVQPS